MVDVGAKDVTHRRATARAEVKLSPKTIRALRNHSTPKGDVLAAARIAGISAAKRTPELIPLCHTVFLTKVTVELTLHARGITVDATAEARDRTGVEMEAMVAASVAALTLYDMLKGTDRSIAYEVFLLEKTGGKSGTWTRGAHVR